MQPTWMVRAGRGARNIDAFLDAGIVAMGAERLGPLSERMGRSDLLELHARHYPEGSTGFPAQLHRFLTEVRIGDRVVTYDRERRTYLVGTVRSGYEWMPGKAEGAPHVRRVEWTHRVARDALGPATRNTLGSIMTFFRVGEEAVADLERHLVPFDGAPSSAPPAEVEASAVVASPPPEADTAADVRAEIVEKADEFIEDRIARLDWMQMQELVAGILRAMGYRTTVSEPGPDRGVDIFASPDGLGLQEPRIFVEVKHQTAPMGAQQIRAFLGGRKPGDRCLYVSTGGFSRDARYEAERAVVPIHLVGLPELRKLLVEHYDLLDGETRALVPLKRLFWPVD